MMRAFQGEAGMPESAAGNKPGDASKPLSGVRVVEFGTLIAGPFCARVLAEFGAEVIKIESPDGGDPLRQWRKMHEGTSLWWYVQARNKKSLTLNLKDPEAAAIARKLCAQADIVIENFRPGVMEKLGLGWETLRVDNPGLVMVRLSGFGQTGPMAQKPGFGAIGESMGGLRYITGFPDRPPVKSGISIGDSIAGLWGAIGALLALRHREQNGGSGQLVDVALYEAVFSMMESMVPEFDVAGFVRERTGNVMPGITPSNTHTTRDGEHIVIGANGDAIFVRLMRTMDREDLATDPGLAGNAGRSARADELYAAIDAWVSTHDAAEVLASLEAAEVPATKVYSVADMFRDAQYAARGMLEEAHLPDGKPFRIPGVMPKLGTTPGSTEWIGPTLGEHTDALLAELGLPPEEVAALRARKAI
jgi:formyl-CoA transferase